MQDENKIPRKKTTMEQFNKLVELMQEHPDIAKGLGAFGASKRSNAAAWAEFSVVLNGLGPPIRDGKGWNKVWLDYKLKLKNKISTNKRQTTATGGGPYVQLSLSPMEQAVDALLCLMPAAIPDGRVFGVAPIIVKSPQIDEIVEADIAVNVEAIQTHAAPSRKRRIEEREAERVSILKEQSNAQINSLQVMERMETHLREICKCNKKMYELAKQKEERKQEELNIKKRKLELMEKKFQIKYKQ